MIKITKKEEYEDGELIYLKWIVTTRYPTGTGPYFSQTMTLSVDELKELKVELDKILDKTKK